jgi:hypothetical protein
VISVSSIGELSGSSRPSSAASSTSADGASGEREGAADTKTLASATTRITPRVRLAPREAPLGRAPSRRLVESATRACLRHERTQIHRAYRSLDDLGLAHLRFRRAGCEQRDDLLVEIEAHPLTA